MTTASTKTVNYPLSRLQLALSPSLSLLLRMEAKRRGIGHDVLAAEILKVVVSDHLFAAVLDR